MPKNKGKGGKNKKRSKNNEGGDEKRELVYKIDGQQEYAQVVQMLGNGRFDAMCIDGVKRLCHIRGEMHKKVWIAVGDIVLISLRDFQDEKGDVVHRYMPDEARRLKAEDKLPKNIRLNEGIASELDDDDVDEDYFEFLDEEIDINFI
ncbi:hypothetical protein AQUCO_03900008v1 [Aquilegia coerulea]|uniref:Eukaryotic translation initiation factor 4C n=1 Tax=Aquilegia coerulea TaxID=218851 RepID=A0A2G5CRF6_AQUCA|nr:hypothetical protein AQUCO_03900008v1 [Aquilegia coerulea]